MKPVVSSDQQPDAECLKLADHVAALVLGKFSDISDKLSSDHARRKVLAGVVMTSPTDAGRVICVTTGTKCIKGEYLSDSGVTVNDSHAEVLARRCLARFLYVQIQQFIVGAESVFIPSDSGSGFALKSGVEFHLYISSAPCGDARIFSPHESDSKDEDSHPNRLARGQLRTKIESGEGTIPVQSSDAGLQTWDGIMLGERLLTMSCSDKVARMNVLGVQGALLSLLVEPVYWSSVVIGSLYHRDHMTRAVFGRIQLAEGSTLPVGYRLARPMLSAVSQPETRLPQKAPSHAVSWLINSSQTEILNIMTGKQMNGDASQLCKAEMFRLFAETWNQLNSGEEFPAVYADVKKMADDYQAAKIALYKALRAANLGCWMERPVEQDHFVLPK